MHHSDHGVQYISTVYTTRVMEYGMLPSTGTVGDSYDCFTSIFLKQFLHYFSAA